MDLDGLYVNVWGVAADFQLTRALTFSFVGGWVSTDFRMRFIKIKKQQFLGSQLAHLTFVGPHLMLQFPACHFLLPYAAHGNTHCFGAGRQFANVALRVICSVEGNAAADGVPQLALFLPHRLAEVYWCFPTCGYETRLEWAGTGRHMFHVRGCPQWSHWKWWFANPVLGTGKELWLQQVCQVSGKTSVFAWSEGLQHMQSWALYIKFASSAIRCINTMSRQLQYIKNIKILQLGFHFSKTFKVLSDYVCI